MCLFFAANNEKILLTLSNSLCDVPIQLNCFTQLPIISCRNIFKHSKNQLARQHARAHTHMQEANIFCTNVTCYYAPLSPL